MMLRLAKLFSPDLEKLARSSGVMQVLTISVSHYCELACWSLQLGGKAFHEHGYAPGQHVLPVLAFRVGDKARKHLSTTSRVQEVQPVDTSETAPLTMSEEKRRRKDAATRSTATPVAVLPDGTVLLDSWDIAAYSGLAPIDPEFKKLLDEELGPLSRQRAYISLLQPSNLKYLDQICTEGRSWIWRLIYWIRLRKDVKHNLFKTYRPTDAKAADQCKEKLVELFDQVGRILNNRQTKYLGGNQVGVADIALASLVAPLVNPPLYCGGKYAKIFNTLMESNSAIKKETDFWRGTIVGEYTLEIYQKYRLA